MIRVGAVLGIILAWLATPAVAVIITVCPPLAQCEDTPNPWDPPCHLQTTPPDWRTPTGKVEFCWAPNATDPNKYQLDAIACKVNQFRNLTAYNIQNCPSGSLPQWVYAYSLISHQSVYDPTLTYIPPPPPPPPPACTHTFAISNSALAPWSREIKIQSQVQFAALLPGNLSITVEPNSTWRPALSLPYPTTSPSVYIANLLVPRSGGPWQITLTLPAAFTGCQISSAEWPDPSLLPGQFVAAKPKLPQHTDMLLRYLDLHRGNLTYIEAQMSQHAVNSPMWKIMDRTRQALIATIARTQTVIMDPIDTNYLVNPPAVSVPSLGPNLPTSPGITSAMIGTVNNWHKKMMALEASLFRATQWVDKMNGALLAGNHARAVTLAAGADTQFENAYTLAKAEVALRKTIYGQWATTFPSPAHCTTVADGEEHVELLEDLGFAPADALPIAYVTPEECVPSGAWPTALTNPAMRADLLAEYLVLHNISVKANLCASAGVC